MDSTTTKPQPPIKNMVYTHELGDLCLLHRHHRGLICKAGKTCRATLILITLGCVGQMHLLDCHVLTFESNHTELKWSYELSAGLSWSGLAAKKFDTMQPTNSTLIGFSKALQTRTVATSSNGKVERGWLHDKSRYSCLDRPMIRARINPDEWRCKQRFLQSEWLQESFKWMIKMVNINPLWMNLCLGEKCGITRIGHGPCCDSYSCANLFQRMMPSSTRLLQ